MARLDSSTAALAGGKAKEIRKGPRESGDAMPKEFNALAVDGWEYVGPVTSVDRASATTIAVLVLFKRAKE